MGPVSGPRSASTSRRSRVAGLSAPKWLVASCARAPLAGEVSELICVRRGLAMLNRLALACDPLSLRPSGLLHGAELVKKRVATAAPALRLLQRRQLLWLAEQTAGTALLGTLSLVVGHDSKLPVACRCGSNIEQTPPENADERTRTSTRFPGHGPELCSMRPDTSASVRIVRAVRFQDASDTPDDMTVATVLPKI
jgi:hypothetical protein